MHSLQRWGQRRSVHTSALHKLTRGLATAFHVMSTRHGDACARQPSLRNSQPLPWPDLHTALISVPAGNNVQTSPKKVEYMGRASIAPSQQTPPAQLRPRCPGQEQSVDHTDMQTASYTHIRLAGAAGVRKYSLPKLPSQQAKGYLKVLGELYQQMVNEAELQEQAVRLRQQIADRDRELADLRNLLRLVLALTPTLRAGPGTPGAM